MGTWGSGPFDSDPALDFAGDVAAGHTHLIEEALNTAVRSGGELDDAEGAEAYAAAACVALALGAEGVDAPAEVLEWARGHFEEAALLRVTALEAVAALRKETSELLMLWAEDGNAHEFLAGLRELTDALRPSGPF